MKSKFKKNLDIFSYWNGKYGVDSNIQVFTTKWQGLEPYAVVAILHKSDFRIKTKKED